MKIKDKVYKNAKKETKYAFLYLILSTIGAIVDCIMFLGLTNLGLPIIPSNIISDFGGMVTSFSLNLRKNFQYNDRIKIRFISYITISIIGMGLSTTMVYFFIVSLGLTKFTAKFLQIVIMAVPLYLAHRLITFRKFGKD